MRRTLLSLVFGVGMATLAQAAPIIYDNSSTGTTLGSGDPFGPFGRFTAPNDRRTSLGETFVAPAGVTFRSISFDIRAMGLPAGPQLVDAYFLAWDNSLFRPVGPILGAVIGLSLPTGPSATTFQRITANFGSIEVIAGQTYVAYFTTLRSSVNYPGAGDYEFDSQFFAPMPGQQFGGQMVYNQNDSFANLTDGSNTWNGPFGGPLAFVAVFDSPELSPDGAGLPLCWVALGLLASNRRRRH